MSQSKSSKGNVKSSAKGSAKGSKSAPQGKGQVTLNEAETRAQNAVKRIGGATPGAIITRQSAGNRTYDLEALLVSSTAAGKPLTRKEILAALPQHNAVGGHLNSLYAVMGLLARDNDGRYSVKPSVMKSCVAVKPSKPKGKKAAPAAVKSPKGAKKSAPAANVVAA